jgi:hypothetical protein
MLPKNYVRLRQICLAAADIGETERVFNHVLELNVCHRSELANFGLENIMYAINGCFLEIVAPTTENTAVDRFLKRNNGRGGYMAIFDCADIDRHKTLAANLGVEPIYERRNDKADLLQLNPKQTGATMMEFDHHYGDDSLLGHYEWAGNDWHQHVSTEVTGSILGIEISSPRAETRGKLWSQIIDRPVSFQNDRGVIDLDYGYVNIVGTGEPQPELFTAIDMTATDPDAMKQRAETVGCRITDTGFDFCGVEFRLNPTN